MRAYVVLGLVFPYQVNRLAWETSPKWRMLCRVGRKTTAQSIPYLLLCAVLPRLGGSVAKWLACWTQAQKGLSSNRSRDAVG